MQICMTEIECLTFIFYKLNNNINTKLNIVKIVKIKTYLRNSTSFSINIHLNRSG